MVEDYSHPVMIHSTGEHLELDVFIEELKLVFEFQGKQHYSPVYWRSDVEAQKRRDKEKRGICLQVLSCISIHHSEWNHVD